MRKFLILFALVAPLCAQTNYTRMLAGVNYQAGASYSLQPADGTKATSFTSSSAVAVCLSSPTSLCSGVAAGSGTFYGVGTLFTVLAQGAGGVTITCQSCTINGAATLALGQNAGADIYGDGTNFIALLFQTPFPAGFGTTSPSYLGDWENTPMILCPACNGDFNQGTANLVFVWQFRLTNTFTFNALSIKVSNLTGGGTTVGIAIYSSTGNRLVHWDSIPYTSSSPPTGCNPGCTVNPTGGAVTLPPGYYYWAAAELASNQSNQTGGGITFSGSGEGVKPWNTRSVVRTGTAANAMSAGVLPATLGTLSAGFPVGTNNLPLWIVEPN